jgi:hypothetical protein
MDRNATASGTSGLSRYGECFISVSCGRLAGRLPAAGWRRELQRPQVTRASSPRGCCIRRTPGLNAGITIPPVSGAVPACVGGVAAPRLWEPRARSFVNVLTLSNRDLEYRP